ncbi:hypothetical protein BDF21DRAFT_457820 [Thamnidium elegans]|nr:hypothetical protein BDF21DRAFT_457820 [Thamnidium elegans]
MYHFQRWLCWKRRHACRPDDGICGCRNDNIAPYSSRNNCNKGFKCLTGEVCTTAGNCVKNPLCHTRTEVCSATEKCCPGFFCHTRLSEPKIKKCYRAANPGEACGPGTGNGIPCIKGSVCLAKTRVCSKVTK